MLNVHTYLEVVLIFKCIQFKRDEYLVPRTLNIHF